MDEIPKEILSGLFQGYKVKTNHGLAGWAFGGLIALCLGLTLMVSGIWRIVFGGCFGLAIVVYAFKLPEIMKRMPVSEELRMAALQKGYEIESDGKIIPLRQPKPIGQVPEQRTLPENIEPKNGLASP